jgi:hypothetical protein
MLKSILAEAYYKTEQTEQTKACYRRSLSFNPENEHARKMLEQLK